jgi:hypothetical protein
VMADEAAEIGDTGDGIHGCNSKCKSQNATDAVCILHFES